MSSRRASGARKTKAASQKANGAASKGKAAASKPKPGDSGEKSGGAKAKRDERPATRTPTSKGARPPARRAVRGGRQGGGEREISAGGVVVRGDEVAVIVPTRRAADGSRVLSLPKGHVDPGETPLQAAGREVREEAGVVAEPVAELGESRYWYRRDGRTIGKSVHFYLFRYMSGDVAEHDEEVEEARWLGFKDAQKQLTYPAEREMVARARRRLKEGERKDR
jgi:8-oxo-dGTP pyrophosphatase MutT (NUDIX family)